MLEEPVRALATVSPLSDTPDTVLPSEAVALTVSGALAEETVEPLYTDTPLPPLILTVT